MCMYEAVSYEVMIILPVSARASALVVHTESAADSDLNCVLMLNTVDCVV